MAEPHPFSVDPVEAIEFLRRKVNVPTRAWTDLWQEMHSVAFMVAGAQSDALLADFHEAVNRNIAEGRTLAQFRADFDRIVAAHGWSYNGSRNWRSAVIFNTNLRMAYASGRWAQIQRLKAVRPYLRYVAVMDARTRPLHAEWHDTVLPVDHPWWQTHFPPNGWNCRCTVQSLSDRDLVRYKLKVSAEAPPVELVRRKAGGMIIEAPKGIDPGFAYRPGAPPSETVRRSLERRSVPAPPVPPAPPPPSGMAAIGALPDEPLWRRVRNEVVDAGLADGREHLVWIDNGAVAGRVAGERGRVVFPPALSARLADPDAAIDVLHNHARGRGFSDQDITTFAGSPGLARLAALGHQGQAYVITRLASSAAGADAEYWRLMQALLRGLRAARLLDRVQPYAEHLVMQALARRGLFGYAARIDRAGEKLIARHRKIIEAAIGPIGE